MCTCPRAHVVPLADLSNPWTVGLIARVAHVPADNDQQCDVFQPSLRSGSAWKIDSKMYFRMCQIFLC